MQLWRGADMNAQCIMVCSGKGGTGKKYGFLCCWVPALHGWAVRSC